MSTAIQPYAPNLAELMSIGKVMAASGLFQDARQEAQAVVKVLAGAELGFPAVVSMTSIHIISGRVTLSAGLIAAAIKRSGRYNYRITRIDNEACELAFFERDGGKWEQIGSSSFTLADARKAGTKNLDKFPRNMLFARALSNGARWYTPDIFGGPIYTPEEMGAEVDEEGQVTSAPEAPPTVEPVPVPEPTAEPAILCEECGFPIAPAFSMDARQLAIYTFGKYQRELCAACATEAAKAVQS